MSMNVYAGFLFKDKILKQRRGHRMNPTLQLRPERSTEPDVQGTASSQRYRLHSDAIVEVCFCLCFAFLAAVLCLTIYIGPQSLLFVVLVPGLVLDLSIQCAQNSCCV